MSALGPYAGFIIGSYLTAAAVIVALLVWVVADHRAQKAALAKLERRGFSRRSSEGS